MGRRALSQQELRSSCSNIYINVKKLEPHYFAMGEVSDVYECVMPKTQLPVAVKVMRGIRHDDTIRATFQERLERLALRWQELDHPNLMKCFGITMQFGSLPGLVFPLCSHGPIIRYIENNKSANKLHLLTQVAAGISFMHSRRFVHADIRGTNILVSAEGTPVIMDGGLTLIVSRAEFTTARMYGPCRWQGPEILDPSDEVLEGYNVCPFTPESDVYSLGMTILEVLTGKVPFSHRRYDTVVILDVIRGLRPLRPEGLSDYVWSLLWSCWLPKPENRPTAGLVERWLDAARCVEDDTNDSVR